MLPERIAHYRVKEKLGEGGMGVVYRAVDEKCGREVAIKLLCTDRVRDAKAVERFHREARITAALSHPHICSVYDFGDLGGNPYMVMELLEGQTLHDALDAGPFSLARIIEVGIQIADALDTAHESGIVHRDIKSTNIFVTHSGDAKILDFGLAKLSSKDPLGLAAALGKENVVSIPGLTVGTVTYMSPEQVTGRDLDRRSDIFSLGIVLYEMATSVLPFQGSNSVMVMQAILSKAYPLASQLNPKLPTEFDRIIARVLEKDRMLRYQTARDLRSDLARLGRSLGFGPRHGQMVAPQQGRLGPRSPKGNLGRKEGPNAWPSYPLIEQWGMVARDGRDFAERGFGLMYWFRAPLGSLCYANGFRNTLQPALENRHITQIRFVLDISTDVVKTWNERVMPLILSWAKRKKQALRLEEGTTRGCLYDEETRRPALAWVFAELASEYEPSFKMFANDEAIAAEGLDEAQIFLSMTTRTVRLIDGSQQTVRVPDAAFRVCAKDAAKLLESLRRAIRRWDGLFV